MRKLILTLVCSVFTLITFAQTPKNMVQRSHMRFPGKELSNICGYVDSLGNEYALVGTSTGMTIVDVTNPDSIFTVASFIGPNSIWREIKTWKQYAYVTTEGGGGLQIIDMRNLPGTVLPQKSWTPTIFGQTLNSIHALHIDSGYVYLYGSNIGNKGIVIGDLTDPWNPVFAGIFDGGYVHDGYVRNDTVWAGQIYAGTFSAIDVSNKANPVVLNTQQTPNAFTHNTWLSDNSKYLFTTDEVNNSYLASYDVSNVNNIIYLDKIQSQYPGSLSIVHNTHILNDYAITSWYKDGVVITDCHRPQNLINVGYIDDVPASGGGFDGVWGVYPFLPSGTIVTSDIDSGLYVYTPTYVRACYLEGVVRDSLCNTLLNNVQIELIGTSVLDSTDFTGDYKTGTPDSGTYTAQFSKAGYITKTVQVSLSNGVVTIVDCNLLSNSTVNLTGSITEFGTGSAVSGANVEFSNLNSTYSLLSDNSGSYENCATVAGQYDFTIGKWGYETQCFDSLVALSSPSINVTMHPGYSDDFSFDFGWTANTTATTGAWVRDVPVGTSLNFPNDANPGNDVTDDCSNKAFVTGNAGGQAATDDVDGGATTLYSPIFDMTGYILPELHYSRWFFNAGGTGVPNDSLHILLSNGITTIDIENVTINTPGASTWMNKSVQLNGLIPFTSTMQLIVRSADAAPGHIVEAGFDNFKIIETGVGIKSVSAANDAFSVSPNPSNADFMLQLPTWETGAKNYQINITDVTGRIVETTNLQQASTRFGASLLPGIYFVTLSSEKQSSTQRIVKY